MTTATDVLSAVRPVGYRLLVRLLVASEKTKGGVILPEATRKAEEIASQLGEVVACGSMAYLDAEKFPDGAWCQTGDHIMMRSYSGTSFKIDGEEYRLINDDTVEAVVGQPDRVSRSL
jgi:chaperonin GroES